MKALVIEDNKEIIESISLVFHIRWPEAVVVAADAGEKGIGLVESEVLSTGAEGNRVSVVMKENCCITAVFRCHGASYPRRIVRQIRRFFRMPLILLGDKPEREICVKGALK